MKKIVRTCGVRIRNGKLCTRAVPHGGFCWQHRSGPSN